MIKKILGGVTLGLLGLGVVSGTTMGAVEASNNPQISENGITLLSNERAIEKKDWNFSGAHYQPLGVSYTIPANSLVVFEGSSSNYLSGAVDVTEFINVTDNLKVAKVDENYILNLLKKAEIKKVKDCLILTIDKGGSVFVQAFNESYKTFNVKPLGQVQE